MLFNVFEFFYFLKNDSFSLPGFLEFFFCDFAIVYVITSIIETVTINAMTTISHV